MSAQTLDENRWTTNEVDASTTTEVGKAPRLLAEVLKSFADRNASNLPALKSKASLLSDLLKKPAGEITIDDLEDAKPILRGFLTSRRMAENSIRTYVNRGDDSWKDSHRKTNRRSTGRRRIGIMRKE
jgi:hypothetical protein